MASSELNSLNIQITADATPAATALKTIGSQAEITKKQIDELSASVTATSNAVKNLTSSLGSFDTGNNGDPMNLTSSAKKMETIQSNASDFAKSVAGVGKSLESYTDKIKSNIREINTLAGSLAQKFSNPKKVFYIDAKDETRLDTIIQKIDKSRAAGRLYMEDQRKHYEDILEKAKLATAESAKKIGIDKNDFTTTQKGANNLARVASAFARGEGIISPASAEAIGKAVEKAIRTASGPSGQSAYESKYGGKNNGNSGETSDAIRAALDRHAGIVAINTKAMNELTASVTKIANAKWLNSSPASLVRASASERRRMRKAAGDQTGAEGDAVDYAPRPRRRRRSAAATDPVDENTKALREATRAYTHFGATMMYADLGTKALRYGYDNISELQKMQARVSAWGLDRKNMAMFEYQTKELQRTNPLMSYSDAYSMMMSASSSLGHYDPKLVGQTVHEVTKYAQLERALGYNASDVGDIAKNYYGVAEARQVANDVQKTLETFRTVFRITTTTAGKITVGDIETILRNMGPGAATITDEGLLRLLAYAEQIKVAGRGASGSAGAGISTVGTNVKMLQLMAMGKPSSIHAKKMLAELGLLEDGAYIEDANGGYKLNTNGKGQNEASRLIVGALDRISKGEGGLNQVVGDIVIGKLKTFSSVGFYDKKLAQEDPVKFVESIVPLIDAYTVKDFRRSEYYGEKGRQSAAKGETDQQFYDSLTEAELTSAMTTFWAKTGLSQRVVTALATFSNLNFQQRSEHMMKTAMHQKSADQMMKEEMANGNLTLASQRVEKSLQSLIQTFEPLGQIFGKVMITVSELIDGLTKWIKEYQVFASITAGWIVFKTLTSIAIAFIGTYDLLNPAMKKNMMYKRMENSLILESNKLMERSIQIRTANGLSERSKIAAKVGKATSRVGGFMSGVGGVISSMFNLAGLAAMVKSGIGKIVGWFKKPFALLKSTGFAVAGKLLAKFASVFKFIATRAIPWVGAALVAIDITTLLYNWTNEFFGFGKGIKKFFEEIGESISSWNIWERISNIWKFGFSQPMSESQKFEAKTLEDQIEAKEKTIKAYQDALDDVKWTLNRNRTPEQEKIFADYPGIIEKLKNERDQLYKEKKEVESGYQRELNTSSALDRQYEDELKKTDFFKLLKDLNEALGKLKDQKAKLELAKSGSVRYSDEVVNTLEKSISESRKNIDDITGKIGLALSGEGATKVNAERQRHFTSIENELVRKEVASRDLKLLEGWIKEAGENISEYGKIVFDTKELSPEKTASFNPIDSVAFNIGQFQNIVDFLRNIAVSSAETAENTGKIKFDQTKDDTSEENSKVNERLIKGLPQILNKKMPAVFDRLQGDVMKWMKDTKNAQRPVRLDEYGNEIKDFEYYRQAAREAMKADLVAGKYKNSLGAIPFIVDQSSAVNGVITEENIDLSQPEFGKSGGRTGNDIADIRATAEFTKQFYNDANRAIQSERLAIRSILDNIEDLQNEIEDWAVPSNLSQPTRALKKLDDEYQKAINGILSGRKLNELDDVQKKRINEVNEEYASKKYVTTIQSLLSATKAYKTNKAQKESASMTDEEASLYNFEQQMSQTANNFKAWISEIQKYYRELVAQANGDKDKLKKIEDEIGKPIRYVKNAFNESQKAEQDTYEKNIKDDIKAYRDNVRANDTAGMTKKELARYEYKNDRDLEMEAFNKKLNAYDKYVKNRLKSFAEGSDEYIKEKARLNALIDELETEHRKVMEAKEKKYLEESRSAELQNMRQKVEDWKNLNSQICNLQDEMMEGFVTANEKWLDGDRDSWRDYANDILKILRNMFLKQGYAQLFGMIFGDVTSGIRNFTGATFGLKGNYDPESWAYQTGKFINDNTVGLVSGTTTTDTTNSDAQKSVESLGQASEGASASIKANQNATNDSTQTVVQNTMLGTIWGTVMRVLTGGMTTMFTKTTTGSMAFSSFNYNLMMGTNALYAFNAALMNMFAQSSSQAWTNAILKVGMGVAGAMAGGAAAGAAGGATAGGATAGGVGAAGISSSNPEINALESAYSSSIPGYGFNPNMAANGGIMTDMGMIPLKKYANGGIARSAQVAIFGEGRMPEAYVPLPDGRSIPVTITGDTESSNARGNNVMISINVTNNAEGGSSESSSYKSDNAEANTNFQKLANNIKNVVKEEIYNQSRPGGLLYNGR